MRGAGSIVRQKAGSMFLLLFQTTQYKNGGIRPLTDVHNTPAFREKLIHRSDFDIVADSDVTELGELSLVGCDHGGLHVIHRMISAIYMEGAGLSLTDKMFACAACVILH
jgi:hypothetical protein